MTIQAVVFDIGGVLALEDEPMDFDKRWEEKLGLEPGAIGSTMADVWDDGAVGRVTEAEVRAALATRLGFTPAQVEGVMGDMWRQYLGVANVELIAYVRTLRPAFRTGILSNSFVGAREREHAAFGLGDLVDVLLYSHEVGMNKPDPALWQLTCDTFSAAPGELVFVDNSPRLVKSAQEFGINAVLFQNTTQVITAVNALVSRR